MSQKLNPVVRYVCNIALGLDCLGNAFWGGSHVETISSRLGRIKAKNGGQIPWYRPARYLAVALDMIQKDHCENSIEKDPEDLQEIKDESIIDKP
jgi:hypothetical protein